MDTSDETTPFGADEPTADTGDSDTASGWDPFEVWRSRILLPRQARQVTRILKKPR